MLASVFIFIKRYYLTYKILYNMKTIIIDENSIFEIRETDLQGNIIDGQVISSYHFMMFERKKLESVKYNPDFAKYLWEYSAILKALVKNEMLAEMQKRIENIDTYYQ